MFFHPVREIKKVDSKKVKSPSVKDIKERYDKIGLKPIQCLAPILKEFRNDFGWIRNDIQQFLRTSDPNLQASIVKNLEVVNQSEANVHATVQDVFDQIVPSNLQTPAEIERFGRVLAERYDGYVNRHTKVADLTKNVKSESVGDDESKQNISSEVSPEV